jgi:hypothetical protein
MSGEATSDRGLTLDWRPSHRSADLSTRRRGLGAVPLEAPVDDVFCTEQSRIDAEKPMPFGAPAFSDPRREAGLLASWARPFPTRKGRKCLIE